MAEIRFIVDRLCESPFKKNLTLVTFDELSPFELLSLLNEVFATLDPRHLVDLRDEPQEQTGNRFIDFLKILKYNPPQQHHDLRIALVNGERSAIYPVLHWVLSRLEPLQKRAYLARYLVSVEVPPAYLHEESVQEVYQQYKALQQEFKETHKTVDRLRKNTLAPGELKKEITQLEEEKQQLKEKISLLKKKTESMEGFEELFSVTSELRREQEEEGKLQDRRREQHNALANAEQRYGDVSQKLSQMNAAHEDNAPPIELLRQLQREVEGNRKLLGKTFRSEIQSKKMRLQELQQNLREPTKTLSDVQDKENQIANLEQALENLREDLEHAQRSAGGDDKLKRYRQQSSMVTKKLEEKLQELEDVRSENEKIAKEIQHKENAAAELAGPKFMRREEFKQYANKLRTKTAHYKRLKQDLAAVRAESVILSRTEAILKSKCGDLDQFLKTYEEKKRNEQENLSKDGTSEKDEDEKELSLEELSRRLTEYKTGLKEKKTHLAPKIKELREIRQNFQSMENKYLEKKSIYENTAVGLESEKIKLEQECNAHQEECLREESKYHYLNSLMTIANNDLKRVQEEVEFQQGKGRLRRDFKCHQDLYNAKIQQQEQLSKELRKKQKALKQVEGANAEQRQMFLDLKQLLAMKLQVAQNQENGPMGHDDGVLDLGQDIGGANVMTIEQT